MKFSTVKKVIVLLIIAGSFITRPVPNRTVTINTAGYPSACSIYQLLQVREHCHGKKSAYPERSYQFAVFRRKENLHIGLKHSIRNGNRQFPECFEKTEAMIKDLLMKERERRNQLKNYGLQRKYSMTPSGPARGGRTMSERELQTDTESEKFSRDKKEDDNSLKSWLQTIVIAVILAALIRHFIFNTTLVKGPSMEPTLHENDRMICLVLPLYFNDPQRGDIIILDAPDENKEYVKRVIGVPGDEIEILDGKVYVNGTLVDEPYTPDVPTLTHMENRWTLDDDYFFVLGDNRNPSKSVDSRYFGPIPRSSIRSIATFRYFPFSRAGKL